MSARTERFAHSTPDQIRSAKDLIALYLRDEAVGRENAKHVEDIHETLKRNPRVDAIKPTTIRDFCSDEIRREYGLPVVSIRGKGKYFVTSTPEELAIADDAYRKEIEGKHIKRQELRIAAKMAGIIDDEPLSEVVNG